LLGRQKRVVKGELAPPPVIIGGDRGEPWRLRYHSKEWPKGIDQIFNDMGVRLKGGGRAPRPVLLWGVPGDVERGKSSDASLAGRIRGDTTKKHYDQQFERKESDRRGELLF